MLELLYFILAAFGLTQIVLFGSIFNNVRPDWKIFNCPMCFGFWAGVFLVWLSPEELFSFKFTLANVISLGCLSSGTTYILCMLFDDFGIKINRISSKE